MSEPTEGHPPDGHTFPRLVQVMKQLLGPGGCPWDQEQTLASLRPFLLEETYEVLDALDEGTAQDHCGELGDLLMQIVFHAELRKSEGLFGVDDVIGGIADKLVHRHPHVFGDATADTADEVLAQWSEIKEQERAAAGRSTGSSTPGPDRSLSGVPRAMPALSLAQKLTERAANVGFDWPDPSGCRAKIDEELAELDRATESESRDRVESELGDVLFAAVNLARKLDIDAEGALRAATRRFVSRFEYIEDRLFERDTRPRDATPEQMETLWEQAKNDLG